MADKKFIRKSAEEITKLTPEERSKYFEDLSAHLESENKDKDEVISGLNNEIQTSGTSEKAGRKTITFGGNQFVIRGKKHFINLKLILNDKSERAKVTNDSGKWMTTEEIIVDKKLMKTLVDNGSHILKPVAKEKETK